MLKGSGALVLALLSGCGARSSTLESDAVSVEPNLPASGSTGSPATGSGGSGAKGGAGGSGTATGGKAGAAPTAGAPGTGIAGSTPSGGASSAGASTGGAASGGGAGIDPYAYNRCTNYCSTTTKGQCPTNISPAECVSSCVNELSGQSLECQKIAATLLDCLTAAYQNSDSCDQFDNLSVVKCASLGVSYQSCAGAGVDPVPTPAPDPSPAPTCSSSGSSSNGSCTLDVKCDNGAYYAVNCFEATPSQSSCTCKASLPGGSGVGVGGFSLNESVTFACYDSLASCGFPQIGAQ